MKRLMGGACLLALIATYALATAPDWQDQRSQTVREVWRFRDAAGVLTVTNGYRAYVSGADSADAENQADFTAIPADSAYYVSTMCTGAPMRSGRYDIYLISPGTDSLIYSFAYLNGTVAGKYAVDDTSMADGVVLSRHVLDRSLVSADIDTGAVTSVELADDIVLTTLEVTGLSTLGAVIADTVVVDSLRVKTDAKIVGDIAADSVTAAHVYATTIEALTGVTSGAVTAGEFNETTGHWWAHADSSWSDMGAWYTNRFKIGSGEATDRLTVDGSLSVTGTASTGALGVTGQITASTKMAAGDSVCAHGALITGTASAAGSLVVSDGSSNTLTLQTSAMSANAALTLFTYQYVDTVLLSTSRPGGADREISKGCPGSLPGDFVIMSAEGQIAGTSLAIIDLATGGISETAADSMYVFWPSAADNKILTYLVLRR